VTAAVGDFLDELPDTTFWCEGTPLTLTTERGYFDYSWNDGEGTAQNFKVTGEGLVTLIASNAAGCTDADSTLVVLRDAPELDLGPDLIICPTDTLRLDAGVGEPATFLWNVPGRQDSILAVPEAGEYIVQVIADNCILLDTAVIDFLPAPLASPITGTEVVCPGTRDVLYTTEDSLGSSFTWWAVGGVLAPTGSDTAISVDWGAANETALVGYYERTPEGCISDTVLFPVRVNVELKPNTPSGADTVCITDSIQTYRTQNTTGSQYTWWLTDGGQLRSGQGISEVTVRWTEPGYWPLYVAEANTTQDTACAGISDTLWVWVYEDEAQADLVSVTREAPNSERVQLEIAAQYFPDSIRLQLFRRVVEGDWALLNELFPANGFTMDQPNFSAANIYEYRLEAVNSCNVPLVSATHPTLYLEVDTAGGAAQLTWNPYTGWDPATTEYAIFRKLDQDEDFQEITAVRGTVNQWTYTDTQSSFVHQFYIEARGGSPLSQSVSNIASATFDNPIFVPTIFTPNGDGINDTYAFRNIHLYQPNTFTVLNRHGDRIFEAENYMNEWTGNNLPEGVYYILLESPWLGSPIKTTV
ncbi:MAG: gliding motility-associated C-terminal domain-containing protein, partial [Bacteroidota bacterium]